MGSEEPDRETILGMIDIWHWEFECCIGEEMSRLLRTGDAQDVQFEVGASALLALAFRDADRSVEGWDDAEHVQTSNQGFIEGTLVA